MRTFAELLSEYTARTGISDAELARSTGVRRQTVFRWKEGLVKRPRHREDVLRCAQRLRLSPEERDALLVAAGFPPEGGPADPTVSQTSTPTPRLPSRVAQSVISDAGQTGRHLSPLVWWGMAAALLVVVGGFLLLVIQTARSAKTFPVAGEGETLIVVGRFVNYVGGPSGYNVAGRIQTALKQEFEAAQLPGARVDVWPEEIHDEAMAAAVAQRAQAAVVIWGEYDSGRVLTRFTMGGTRSEPDGRRLEALVASASDLSATINSTLPSEVQYVALMTLGQLYADQGNFDRAQAVLNQALIQAPEEPDALATLYFFLGYIHQIGEPANLDQAIHYYSQVISLQPEWATAYNNRGIAFLDRAEVGDLDRAIEDLTQAIATKPNYAVAHINRGVAYLEGGGPDGMAHALEDLSRAIDLAPSTPQAYINRGLAYVQRNQVGDLARAVEDFTQAINLAPDAVGGYLNRGLAYVREGERERWSQDFEQVLALAPDNADAHNALCWAYALNQQPNLALPYCDTAVDLDPTGRSHDSRGVVYAELGRLEEAAEEFEIFLDWLKHQSEGSYRRYGLAREAWLQALEAGRNPIDPETLEELRQE
jgi:tetratricopeptide (TPR) repeat protein